MKNRAFYILVALTLVLCVFCVPALTAGAETTEEITIDVSDHMLQAGGFLPEASAQPKVARGDGNAAVKKAIYDGLRVRQPQIDLSAYSVPASDIAPIYCEVVNENPELFYVAGSISYTRRGSFASSVSPAYTGKGSSAADYQSALQKIVGMLGSGWSDVEKILFLHDYLVTHCEYDHTYSRYSAYDALVNGSAVCQGYALAFNDLCQKSGIQSSLVSSTANNHAWNLVTINGEKYYVDCTWDDPSNDWYEGRCRHVNFLLSKSALVEQKHIGTDWTSNSVNVYNSVETSTRYDDAWWKDVNTAVPIIGHIGAYTLDSDSASIYLRNMSTNAVTTLSLPGSARWYVWGSSSSYWLGNYCSVTSLNGQYYFTLPTSIWSMSPSGQMNRVYQLTADEQAQGYIYGIVNDGGTLYYNIGTEAYNTTFIRAAFQAGPVTGEADGFAYEVLADGTVSITDCFLFGEVVIPGELDGYTVTNLASELFFGMDGVTSITIPATVTGYGEDPLDNTRNTVFAYCDDLERIDVAADNPAYCSVDGVLFSKDKSTLIAYPCNRGGAVYHVDAEELSDLSFAFCYNLKFLFLDNPDTCWYTYTFNYTPEVTVFYIPGGAAEDKAIEEMQEGRVQDGSDENPWCCLVSTDALYHLPAQLREIEEDAFQGTDILYLVAPQGCERIRKGAFVDSGLVYLRVGPNTVIENGALPDYTVVERK